MKKCQCLIYDQVVDKHNQLVGNNEVRAGSYLPTEYSWKKLPTFMQRNKNILFSDIGRYIGYHEASTEARAIFARDFSRYSWDIKENIDKLINFSAKSESEIFEELYKYLELLDLRFMYRYDPSVYGDDLPLIELLKKIMKNFQDYKSKTATDTTIFKLTEEVDYLKKCQAANEDKIKYMADMIDGFAEKLNLKHELT